MIDPLIEQARLVNLAAAREGDAAAFAAQMERNLAARRAMRPARSAAAAKGWERRRG